MIYSYEEPEGGSTSLFKKCGICRGTLCLHVVCCLLTDQCEVQHVQPDSRGASVSVGGAGRGRHQLQTQDNQCLHQVCVGDNAKKKPKEYSIQLAKHKNEEYTIGLGKNENVNEE